ncbi:TetR/AcrR family transcriptional regulator [Rhodobacteraceae bacterium F11138]|nr:TetR/AcrR family transcriptional regulator [Rhodobacteraceae bacterium F11138]
MSHNKRDELIRNALKVFYRNGFNATGMDKIAKETGVSKTSIYKHFRTKDDLILAVLRQRDADFRNWLFRRMEDLGSTPEEQLIAMFDALEEWFNAGGFQGCMFIKASAEFQNKDDAINRQSYAHKQLLADHFKRLAASAGFRDPHDLARRFLILKEGAIVIAAMSHDPAPAAEAKRIAHQILDSEPRTS